MNNEAYRWLDGGDGRDVVVYSRLRLVRNIHGLLFPGRASAAELAEVKAACLSALLSGSEEMRLFSLEELDPLTSGALRERRWCGAGDPCDPSRAVLFDPRGLVYGVNDRDHLRFSYTTGGAGLRSSLELIRSEDRRLDGLLGWACSEKLGFLASNPKDVGTGLGISALVFIPGIVAADMFERVAQSLLDGNIEPHFAGVQLGSAIEGERVFPFVELRYRCPLGVDEDTAVVSFLGALERLSEGERRTRDRLFSVKGLELEDAAFRAAAILGACRLLSEEEGKRLLTDLRAGVVYGVAPKEKIPSQGGDPYANLDRLILSLGPAQIGLWARENGLGEDAVFLDSHRARLVRNALPRYLIDGGKECLKD